MIGRRASAASSPPLPPGASGGAASRQRLDSVAAFVPVADAWIAACRPAWDLPLAARNRRDFVDFVDHNGLQLSPS